MGLNRLYRILSDNPESLGLHFGQTKLLATIISESNTVEEATKRFDALDDTITELVGRLRTADIAIAIRNHSHEEPEILTAQIVEDEETVSYGDADAQTLLPFANMGKIAYSEAGATVTHTTINNDIVIVIGSEDLFAYLKSRIENEKGGENLAALIGGVLKQLDTKSRELTGEFLEEYKEKIKEKVLQTIRAHAEQRAAKLLGDFFLPRNNTSHEAEVLRLGSYVTAIQEILIKSYPMTHELGIIDYEEFHMIAHNAVTSQLQEFLAERTLANERAREAYKEMTKSPTDE